MRNKESKWNIGPITGLTIIANLCLYLTYKNYGENRAIFALDYFLIAIAAIWLPRVYTYFLLAFALATDATNLIGAIYYFSPSELPDKILHIPNTNFNSKLLPKLIPACFVGLTVLSCVCIEKISKTNYKIKPTLLTVALITALIIADMTNGSFQTTLANHDLRRDSRAITAENVSTLMAQQLLKEVWQTNSPPDREILKQNQIMASATKIAVPKKNIETKESHQKIVLVIIESWGQFNEPKLNDIAVEPLLTKNITSNYRLRRGAIPFHGGTSSAEMRELCGVSNSISTLDEKIWSNCIPNLLKANGYRTIGIHGHYGSTFNRHKWWPQTGIESMSFLPDLVSQRGARECGSYFKGICDDDLIKNASSALAQNTKTFLYILTLNSHAPIPEDELKKSKYYTKLMGSKTVAALMEKWEIVFSAIEKIASINADNDTQFILVGDHRPHLWDKANKDYFSSNEVPYLILDPTPAK